jgi:hypothetical protein
MATAMDDQKNGTIIFTGGTGNDLHQSMCHIQLHLMAMQTTFSATAIILEP